MTFGALAEEVFRRYGRRWKTSTRVVNRSYLRRHLLPEFGERDIRDIDAAHVRRWFAGLRGRPAVANRALPLLSTIMRQAEVYGYRPEHTNPCVGIRRYRTARRERFLSESEMARLGRSLHVHAESGPLAAALVRLLALTGCRQSEIRTLRWRDYREGHVYLEDAKSGPRTVWLSSPARRVLDALPRDGEWVFPCASRPDRPMTPDVLYRHWRAIRGRAGLSDDVRLHDLRHSYASYAMSRGENIVRIGALLGHRDKNTTLRYLHVADPTMRSAVDVVGDVLGDRAV